MFLMFSISTKGLSLSHYLQLYGIINEHNDSKSRYETFLLAEIQNLRTPRWPQ